MADIYDPQTRSLLMAGIRSNGNASTEIKLIKILREFQITGWRRRQQLPGSPDFVFAAHRVAVFVDGCFWHGCPCKARPTSNSVFWNEKLDANKKRDRLVTFILRREGWRVIRIWEHELANGMRVSGRILRVLHKQSSATGESCRK